VFKFERFRHCFELDVNIEKSAGENFDNQRFKRTILEEGDNISSETQETGQRFKSWHENVSCTTFGFQEVDEFSHHPFILEVGWQKTKIVTP